MRSYKNIFSSSMLLLSGLLLQAASAVVLDLDAFGFSINLGGYYSQASLSVDHAGIYIFNPGLGLGYDNREHAFISGWSPIAKSGFFSDCKLVPLYYVSSGMRYTHLLNEDYSISGSILLGLMNGQDWVRSTRDYSLMLLPIFEIGKKIGVADAVKLGVVYAHKNSAMSATAGDGLLFVLLSYSYSF